jgi:hypothetical protein
MKDEEDKQHNYGHFHFDNLIKGVATAGMAILLFKLRIVLLVARTWEILFLNSSRIYPFGFEMILLSQALLCYQLCYEKDCAY